MYKIYINDTPLILTSAQDGAKKLPGNEKNPVHRYTGKPHFLLNYVDLLEKNTEFESVTLFGLDDEQMIADFESLFKILEAGGGLVRNEKNEILFIFRRGSWDLPKGKIDPGETREQAAVREVQEETGIEQITLGKFLCETNHTYRNRKGKRIIKRSYWYDMTTTDTELIPQTEEDIELAVWMTKDDFFAEERVVYQNILEVLKA